MATTTTMATRVTGGRIGTVCLTALVLMLGLARPQGADAAGCTTVTYNMPTRPSRVLPGIHQTPIRDQASRYTCTAFAPLAALEAAYKRNGYGDLDFSEEFAVFVDKMLGLDWDWSKITGPDVKETQVGAFSGGGGAGRLENMVASNFRVPLESKMPYRPNGYDLGPYSDWQHPHWRTQRNQNDFNLVGSKPGAYSNPNALPQAALEATAYYAPAACSRLRPNDTAQLEAAIAQGKDVVWDSTTTFFGGTHSTLLVGYDRSSPNRNDWHFIVKNSWGPDVHAGGYTHLPYDQIPGGYDAVTVDAVRAPSAWPELAALGRWNLSFDGHHGTLDVYHIPGMSQFAFAYYGVTTTDRRIGTFYESNGRAYRVNGYISGNLVSFYIDWSKPNLRWDELPATARHFTYYRSAKSADDRPVMAGVHIDPDHTVWGGYAIKAFSPAQQTQWLAATADPRGTWRPESFIGKFNFRSRTNQGLLTITRRDDSVLASGEAGTYAGIKGTFRSDVTRRRVNITGKVSLAQPNVLTIPSLANQFVQVRKLSHEAGVVAGAAMMDGLYMTRTR